MKKQEKIMHDLYGGKEDINDTFEAIAFDMRNKKTPRIDDFRDLKEAIDKFKNNIDELEKTFK